MARTAKQLTALEVKSLVSKSPSGVTNYHRVGGVVGLLVRISKTNTASWVLRVKVGLKQRDIGLGSLHLVSLSKARQEAQGLRGQIAQGVDPVIERRDARARLIQGQQSKLKLYDLTLEYHRQKVVPLRSDKDAKHFLRSFEMYVFPALGERDVEQITTDDVFSVFEPIWAKVPRVAGDTLKRLERVIAYGFVKHEIGDRKNPAEWKNNLELLLPSTVEMMRKKNGAVHSHQPSLPYAQLPQFMAHLRQREGNGARALEFAILTGARNTEVRQATWAEIDFSTGTWTIPADRMKASREHTVMLSRQALGLLAGLDRLSAWIFTNESRGHHFSDMVFITLIKKMDESLGGGIYIDPKMGGRRVTQHGFRSTLLTWSAEEGIASREVARMAIAHNVRDQLEAAYNRSELLGKRRALMQDWADFVDGSGVCILSQMSQNSGSATQRVASAKVIQTLAGSVIARL